jgi:uncharacterized protein (DUF2147 family)
MKKYFFITATIILLGSTVSFAQQNGLAGKWLTPDGAVISFYNENKMFIGRQTSAALEKDKKYNGKIVAKDVAAKDDNIFEGTVIKPETDKEYKGRFTIDATGGVLELKVKWGFMSFKENWKKIK